MLFCNNEKITEVDITESKENSNLKFLKKTLINSSFNNFAVNHLAYKSK